MSDATNQEGGQSILHQRSLPRCLSFRMIPRIITVTVFLGHPPPLPQLSCYHSPPIVPHFHSSSVLETINASKSNPLWNDCKNINHSIPSSMPVLPPPLFSHQHLRPIIPPFHSSSVWEPINTTSNSTDNEPPSFTQVLPRFLRPHHLPPPIIPPFMHQNLKRVIHRHQITSLL